MVGHVITPMSVQSSDGQMSGIEGRPIDGLFSYETINLPIIASNQRKLQTYLLYSNGRLTLNHVSVGVKL